MLWIIYHLSLLNIHLTKYFPRMFQKLFWFTTTFPTTRLTISFRFAFINLMLVMFLMIYGSEMCYSFSFHSWEKLNFLVRKMRWFSRSYPIFKFVRKALMRSFSLSDSQITTNDKKPSVCGISFMFFLWLTHRWVQTNF